MKSEMVPVDSAAPVALFVPGGLDNIIEQIGTIDGKTAPVLFADGGLDDLVELVRKAARQHVPDVSTDKGRKAVASNAYQVARSRTAIEAVRKPYVAALKAEPTRIDALCRAAFEKLQAIQDEARKPLTAWEAAEKAKAEAIAAARSGLEKMAREGFGAHSELIAEILNNAEGASFPAEWAAEVEPDRARAIGTLRELLAAAKKREADEAELEALRRQKAEREAAEEKARIAREAKEAEDRRVAEARANAERDAEEARAELERERQEAARKERAETDRIIAGLAAPVAEGSDAAAIRARQEQTYGAIYLEHLTHGQREAIAPAIVEAITRLDLALEAAVQAEAEAAEKARVAAEQKAEQDRLAEAQRVEQARLAERERIERAAAQKAADEKAEADKRAADVAHMSTIMGEAKESLMKAGLSEADAQNIVIAIQKGLIDHVSIKF